MMLEPQTLRPIFVIVHLIGFAMGLGAATVVDVSVARFMYRLEARDWQPHFLSLCSRLIWVALGLITLSGLALYALDWQRLNTSPKFIAKMIVVSTIVLNGFIFERRIAAKLTQLFCVEDFGISKGRKERRFAFASGAVSLSSWYTAVILGSLPTLNLGLGPLLGLYAMTLGSAALLSLSFEAFTARRFARVSREAVKEVAQKALGAFSDRQSFW